jgi:hypothetical protein
MSSSTLKPTGSAEDTLKKSLFPRRRESRGVILLGFAFGKNDFSE